MSIFNKTYDLVLSSGPACTPAVSLDLNKLRIFSTPHEYMMNYSLDALAELFETGFCNYFTDITFEGIHSDNYKVKDNISGMVSIHHFPISLEREEGLTKFYEESKRRIIRLYQLLNMADRVLFVSNRNCSVQELTAFRDRISSIFPKIDINCLDVKSAPVAELTIVEIDEHTSQCLFHDIPTDKMRPWVGNRTAWTELLSRITLSSTLVDAYKSLKSKSLAAKNAGA
ncbi:hypothetical protein G3N56_14510 [Desulfovibrio sulfodismutans]|uniref:Papain-like cysteine peptidase n=1 Tax=Desulfolutivibrio sulfodismutans TaxID=63561 RepID=A0A7K3NQ87_9BACT|nr:hypothetical protein [Desulfolutivibrio sulfodismutans]NDY57945.1 hypothetical protein [Desulfolutivibrio sulfodismutans]